MTGPALDLPPPTPARGDRPARRLCLRCRTPFPSAGFGERICKRCKACASWTSAGLSGQGAPRRTSSR